MTGQGFGGAFIAIHPPAELRVDLGALIDRLDHRIPPKSVRWVRLNKIHLTLRFLGDVAKEARWASDCIRAVSVFNSDL